MATTNYHFPLVLVCFSHHVMPSYFWANRTCGVCVMPPSHLRGKQDQCIELCQRIMKGTLVLWSFCLKESKWTIEPHNWQCQKKKPHSWQCLNKKKCCYRESGLSFYISMSIMWYVVQNQSQAPNCFSTTANASVLPISCKACASSNKAPSSRCLASQRSRIWSVGLGLMAK